MQIECEATVKPTVCLKNGEFYSKRSAYEGKNNQLLYVSVWLITTWTESQIMKFNTLFGGIMFVFLIVDFLIEWKFILLFEEMCFEFRLHTEIRSIYIRISEKFGASIELQEMKSKGGI